MGKDLLMRSDSQLDQTHTVKSSFADPDRGRVDTVAARSALKGKEGTEVIMDYNGKPVLSAYTPVEIGGTHWALIAEIDENEVEKPVTTLIVYIGFMALGVVLFVVVMPFWWPVACPLPWSAGWPWPSPWPGAI